jgi:hypothetical protein
MLALVSYRRQRAAERQGNRVVIAAPHPCSGMRGFMRE